MKKPWGDVVGSSLIVGMGVAFLAHFTLIWVHGAFFIQESNTPILVLETVSMVAIVTFGLWRLWNYAKS